MHKRHALQAEIAGKIGSKITEALLQKVFNDPQFFVKFSATDLTEFWIKFARLMPRFQQSERVAREQGIAGFNTGISASEAEDFAAIFEALVRATAPGNEPPRTDGMVQDEEQI